MEQAATGVLDSWLAQLGIFGLGLAVIATFVILWLRESRAVRAEAETVVERKDKELATLRSELAASVAKERTTYAELMACKYPGINPVDPKPEDL